MKIAQGAISCKQSFANFRIVLRFMHSFLKVANILCTYSVCLYSYVCTVCVYLGIHTCIPAIQHWLIFQERVHNEQNNPKLAKVCLHKTGPSIYNIGMFRNTYMHAWYTTLVILSGKSPQRAKQSQSWQKCVYIKLFHAYTTLVCLGIHTCMHGIQYWLFFQERVHNEQNNPKVGKSVFR